MPAGDGPAGPVVREHSFWVATRARTLARLAEEPADLLVIGGGITGAGIAREAALRGLKVALVEKGDFASGTSSKSSKLVHGGLRYLEHHHYGLVRAACRERDRLRKLAPHLVTPLPFLFPVYRGDPVGLTRLKMGMVVYDLLAGFRNVRPHRFLGARTVAAREPALKTDGLRGAALYFDCWTDDARLTLETALDAQQRGALVANYINVRSLAKVDGKIVGAEIADRLSARRSVVAARVVVNAAGPWLDQIRRLDDPRAANVLQVTKGAHILVRRERVKNKHAVVARAPQDRRILFIIPWDDLTLVGATDTYFSGSPDKVEVDDDDVRYLLEAVNDYFPRARLGTSEIVSSYVGLRPLIRPDEMLSPSRVPREEKIFESGAGLISVGGGKLTTFRLMAREVVDRVAWKLGRPELVERVVDEPLPGGRRQPGEVRRELESEATGFSKGVVEHAVSRYGSRAELVFGLLKDRPKLAEPLVPGQTDMAGEAVFASREEMAVKVADVLERRTHVKLMAPGQVDAARRRIKEVFCALGDRSPLSED